MNTDKNKNQTKPPILNYVLYNLKNIIHKPKAKKTKKETEKLKSKPNKNRITHDYFLIPLIFQIIK